MGTPGQRFLRFFPTRTAAFGFLRVQAPALTTSLYLNTRTHESAYENKRLFTTSRYTTHQQKNEGILKHLRRDTSYEW